MNQLVNAVWAQYLKLHRYKINRFMEQPHESQKEELFEILDTAQYTEWGQKYKFSDITTVEEWRQRVPVQDYESIKEDIFRNLLERQMTKVSLFRSLMPTIKIVMFEVDGDS